MTPEQWRRAAAEPLEGLATLEIEIDMKIVMIGDLYDERLQYQDNLFAKYYGRHGHEVTMIASTFENAFDYYAERYDKCAPAREYWDGRTKVIKLPYSINFLNRLRKFGGVRQILMAEKPDLIFSHDIHLNLVDAVWYRRRHPECRIIMDYHADFSNSARNWLSLLLLHRMTRKQLLKYCRSAIDRIYPIVPAGADFLHQVYGVPYEEMTLLPLGADTDLAAEVRASGSRGEIRRQLGIPDDALAIFSGGKLTQAKRTHVLLQALRLLPSKRVHVVVVGDAGPKDTVYKEALLEMAGADPRVHFIGWVDGADVYRYMSACDVAVFPASQSALWQQALSMGLPLIVGHVGVADPSYMNLYGNLTILPEDAITPETIARHIAEVAADRELLAERQALSLRVANELLNYHKLVQETLQSVA